MTEMLVTPDQVVEVVPADTQVLAILDPGSTLVVINPDVSTPVVIAPGAIPELVALEVPADPVTVAIITEGPQGAPGSGGSDPEAGTIVRDGDGNIEQVVLESKTVDIFRTDGLISSITDGEHTWTFTRGMDGSISSWEVS